MLRILERSADDSVQNVSGLAQLRSKELLLGNKNVSCDDDSSARVPIGGRTLYKISEQHFCVISDLELE